MCEMVLNEISAQFCLVYFSILANWTSVSVIEVVYFYCSWSPLFKHQFLSTVGKDINQRSFTAARCYILQGLINNFPLKLSYGPKTTLAVLYHLHSKKNNCKANFSLS